MTLSKEAYKRAFFKAALITAILTPFLWSPLNRFLLNGVLFTPVAYPEGFYDAKPIAGVMPQDVFLTSADGKKLHGWFLKNPNAKYTVLVNHGLTGNISLNKPLLALLYKAQASVFAYDYEGYGRSEGTASVETVCGNALTAYKYLVDQRKISPQKIVLCGESFGTGVTTWLSKNVPAAGMILQSPFVSLRARAIEIFPVEAMYPQSFYPYNALDNTAILAAPHAPLLVIGGVEDHILPINHADTVARLALEPKTYTRINGVGHTGDPRLTDAREYLASLKTFFADLESRQEKAQSESSVKSIVTWSVLSLAQ